MTVSRRSLLRGDLVVPRPALRPPWMAWPDACTGCARCAEVCPQAILGMEQGFPRISFAAECTFCGACAEACPEPVFERGQRAFRHRVLIGGDCLSDRGVACESCRDVCPEAAIRFPPRIGGPPLPALDAAACTGCGACLPVCPASAITIDAEEAADA